MAVRTSTNMWISPLEERPISGPAAEEQAIRQVFGRVGAAWTAGDASVLADAWAPDGDHISLTRVRRKVFGRRALERAWNELFARRTAEYSRQMTVTVEGVRFLTAEAAVVDGALEYTAGIGLSGRRDSATSEPFSAVMLQHDGEWQIAASRVGPTLLSRKFIGLQVD